MKEYTNGQRKGMMYGGMSRRKPMMYGGMAEKPRKKAQMGGSMTTTQKQQNQQAAGMMPMQPMNVQRMAEGGKAFAALAAPYDKATYADKIAGAKKGK